MNKERNVPVEVELKLDVEPDDLVKVLAHPMFHSGASRTSTPQHLNSTYFDTPDHDLKQAGISLRIRRNGQRRIQTIKAAQEQPGIALARGEWEHEVDGDRLDFVAMEETALKPLLKQRDAIRPVFSLSVERAVHELSCGGSLIEVAADCGRIEGQERTVPFGELELELKEGRPADLFKVALMLAEATPLRLSFRTKAKRGFDAISGEKPTKVKAEPVVLKRRMTGAGAFQIIGAACLQHLMANEFIVRQAPEPDAVHQMRVALRRLRAAITLFKDVVADEQRDVIKAELKWMANSLGEARDLDVYLARVLEPALTQQEDDAGLRTLLAETQERRNRAYAKVQETIASPRFVKGVLETAAWIQAGHWVQDEAKAARERRDVPVSAVAKAELARRWKRILKRGKHLADLEPDKRHQVRIEIKKVRYATEFFENLFKGGDAKKRREEALTVLESLQETLGELNDIAVGSHMHDSEAAEAIHEEQLSWVGGLLSTAKAQYADLAALKPFWKR